MNIGPFSAIPWVGCGLALLVSAEDLLENRFLPRKQDCS